VLPASAQDLKDRSDDTEGAGRVPERRVFVCRARQPQAAAELEMMDEAVLRQAVRAAQALLVVLPP
jgi:hypothetical protein